MVAAVTSIHESDDHGQSLVDEVVQLFIDLLVAGGATKEMIKSALANSSEKPVASENSITFTELGSLLRDCMEVMCAWRRDVDLVDVNGEPLPLSLTNGERSFQSLCRKAGCKHHPSEILEALSEFGAIVRDNEGKVHSQTPTFLLGAAAAGGRIATDGLIKHLVGFLQCVHRNVCSVSGRGKAKFERACTVTVPVEFKAVFDRLVRTRGQEFIDSIDEWLERNSKLESPSGTYVELGAGAYFIDLGPRLKRDRLLVDRKKSL